MEEQERGPDDLILPRKKTLTDLWREEWERDDNSSSNRQALNNKERSKLS
jgi:hypothetical protein